MVISSISLGTPVLGPRQSFSNSSGLHVNFGKSFLVPINLTDEKAIHLARTFGSSIGTMPFTYLGLALGTTKPTLQEFTPLFDKD